MAIDTTMVRSRRSLLTATLASLAGAAASTVAGAQRVLAAADDGAIIHVGDVFINVATETALGNNFNNKTVLSGINNQAGIGVSGYSTTFQGVTGESGSGTGVYGSSYGQGVGKGRGVHGEAGQKTGFTIGVLGEASSPDGVGMLGNNYATSGHAEGVQGTSYSPKGWANTGWATKGGTGVVGVSGASFPYTTIPTGTGVFGKAAGGRGVVASGGKAQLRLVPSAATTHPTSGALGDLFLDKNKRLWFCKGGATWVKLA
jgi:hypothetical protein